LIRIVASCRELRLPCFVFFVTKLRLGLDPVLSHQCGTVRL
jgi:hypothetical protein